MKISLVINMKMPTVVGIFMFISRENFMLSLFEHEKSFITSGPGLSKQFPDETKIELLIKTNLIRVYTLPFSQYFYTLPDCLNTRLNQFILG